ncbi:MAG: hypothetical protein O2807_09805 [bacterium]|nr:hypothetical protein [bacterium]
MCHQTVGQMQGAIEKAGIPCVSITLRPEVTSHMRISRAVYLRFPLGRPVGEPGAAEAQKEVLRAVLSILERASAPDTILEAPFRWRRVRSRKKT